MKNLFIISPVFKENLKVSLKSLRNNMLRSVITIFIIALGITSLVGILTATDALKMRVMESFDKMGSTTFYITREWWSSDENEKKRVLNNAEITYNQTALFKENFNEPCIMSIFSKLYDYEIKYESKKTTPDIVIVACDEGYLPISKINIAKGRGFVDNDLKMLSNVCVIGSSVVKKLFNIGEDPIDKIIFIKGVRYKVIGVMEEVGFSMRGSADKEVLIPVTNARSSFFDKKASFTIGVSSVPNMKNINYKDKAEQIMRSVRRLTPIDKTDFMIESNDGTNSEEKKVMDGITKIAAVIGLITLLGAAVALMNIMLVSVKERTREIGTRKALGASSKRIKEQFLLESVVISQIGCILGVLLGFIIGNVTAIIMDAPFVIPWLWIISSIVVCFIVGILSGYIPALRAAKLDPIEALRYE